MTEHLSDTQRCAEADIPLAGTAAIREANTAKKAELAERNVILMESPEDFPAYFKIYNRSQTELIELSSWSKASMSRRGITSLPKIFVSDEVRLRYGEMLRATGDNRTANAKYLYSIEDFADFMHRTMRAEVLSVLVPLSMFADNPDGFRAEFLAEKSQRTAKFLAGLGKRRMEAISRWKCMKHLRPGILEELAQWKADYKAEKERQGVAWPVPTSLAVDFPDGVIPRYRTLLQVAEAASYPTPEIGRATVYHTGMAKHMMIEPIDQPGNPTNGQRFTPGLLLGEENNRPDYEIGLLDVMSIPRALRLLGEDYLKSRPWRIVKDDVLWCRDKSVLNEVKLSREARKLMGLQTYTLTPDKLPGGTFDRKTNLE